MVAGLLLLGVLAFVGLALCVSVIFSAREWSVHYYLRRNGELTDAAITNLFTENKKGTNYFIAYQYYVGDTLFDAKQQISRRHYKQFQRQDYVTIRFAPTKPNWSRLGKSDFDNTIRSLSTYAAFAGLLVLGLPAVALWIVSFIGIYLYLALGSASKKKKRLEI